MIVTPNGKILYECDREKNTECKYKNRSHCCNGLTPCHMTSNREFASDKEDFKEQLWSLTE